MSLVTDRWLADSDPEKRKTLGQYMTPIAVRDRLIDKVELFEGQRVLDPGVGTGEFLRSVIDREPGVVATGWDIDQEVLTYTAELAPEAKLQCRQTLGDSEEQFDLIIGNPPYFQISGSALREKFSAVISGRANIFACFIQASLDLLVDGGQLAFVVPPSMNSGSYFQNLRQEILRQGSIVDLEILSGSDLFEGATTAIQLIVIRKGSHSDNFVFRHGKTTLFSENPDELNRAFRGKKALWELGYVAKTGTVVWNQHRENLREERSGSSIRLIWSKDLSYESLMADDGRKKWIEGVSRAPEAVLVNRIVGQVGSGALRVQLSPDDPYCAENHVNMIIARKDVGQEVSRERLAVLLRDPGVTARVRMITGNTQISATELTHLLPLG